MATHRNALQLFDAQVTKFRGFRGTAVQAWSMLPEGAEQDLRDLLSGTLTPEQTRGQFARKAPLPHYDPRNPTRTQIRRVRARGAVPLLPINKQSGRLFDSITREPARVPGTLSAESVGLDPSIAKGSIFAVPPSGTRTTVSRGLWAELKKRWRTRNAAFREVFVRAQRKAMQ